MGASDQGCVPVSLGKSGLLWYREESRVVDTEGGGSPIFSFRGSSDVPGALDRGREGQGPRLSDRRGDKGG